VELEPGETAIGLTGEHHVVVKAADGTTRVKKSKNGSEVSDTTKREGDRSALLEQWLHQEARRVVWRGCGKAMVMEDKHHHQLVLATLE
jgi:hypothetical protein